MLHEGGHRLLSRRHCVDFKSLHSTAALGNYCPVNCLDLSPISCNATFRLDAFGDLVCDLVNFSGRTGIRLIINCNTGKFENFVDAISRFMAGYMQDLYT